MSGLVPFLLYALRRLGPYVAELFDGLSLRRRWSGCSRPAPVGSEPLGQREQDAIAFLEKRTGYVLNGHVLPGSGRASLLKSGDTLI